MSSSPEARDDSEPRRSSVVSKGKDHSSPVEKGHRRSFSSRSPPPRERERGSHHVARSPPPRQYEKRPYDSRGYSPPPTRRGGGEYHEGSRGGRRYPSPPPYYPEERNIPYRPSFLDRSRGVQSKCLGIFGMSLETNEKDLKSVFSRYGPIEEITLVKDYNTGRSRGFAFIYFKYLDDAVAAKETAVGEEIDGRPIRIDYSMTQKPNYSQGGGPARGPPRAEERGGYYEQRSGGGGRGSYGRAPLPYAREYSPDPYYRGGYEARRYEGDQLDRRDYARCSRREYGGRRSRSFTPPRRRY